MSVTGIEISETAIALARSRLGLEIPIFHGSVTDMPFDQRLYDGIYCFGLVYLLDAHGREKLIRDCYRQLTPGGRMIFTLISKKAPMYGQGPRLGEDWYERLPEPANVLLRPRVCGPRLRSVWPARVVGDRRALWERH
jgi:SAM-dependent methyltransferase